MTSPDSYFTNDGQELHRGCDGEIMNFKDGWICGECKEGGEWAAATVPTESTESASNTTQTKPQAAPVTASTEGPSGSAKSVTTDAAGTSTEGLQVLVAQHFERLDRILANTIRQLEELKRQIPDAALKEKPLLFHYDVVSCKCNYHNITAIDSELTFTRGLTNGCLVHRGQGT